jgi:hypothetical protein
MSARMLHASPCALHKQKQGVATQEQPAAPVEQTGDLLKCTALWPGIRRQLRKFTVLDFALNRERVFHLLQRLWRTQGQRTCESTSRSTMGTIPSTSWTCSQTHGRSRCRPRRRKTWTVETMRHQQHSRRPRPGEGGRRISCSTLHTMQQCCTTTYPN